MQLSSESKEQERGTDKKGKKREERYWRRETAWRTGRQRGWAAWDHCEVVKSQGPGYPWALGGRKQDNMRPRVGSNPALPLAP